MPENISHINYSFADINRYLNGGMTAKEMHEIERAALLDPFLADAIEGYRDADTSIATKHLNEISAVLQNEQPASVVSMPPKKSYRWLVAASLLAVIGAGIFLFTSTNKSSAPLADNTLQTSKQKTDSAITSFEPPVSQPDSQSITSTDRTLAKPKEESRGRMIVMGKKKQLSTKETTSSAVQTPQQESADVAKAYQAPVNDKNNVAMQKPQAQVATDSAPVIASAQVKKGFGFTQSAPANPWTNDKGKPFLLSDVEVIRIGKNETKKTDTSLVKPVGGWQLFQDYLFSRLSRKDSLSFVNSDVASNLELEFSIDENGSPYNVKVLHAEDSTITHKIADAVQSGPKWTSGDKKSKRFRLRY